MLRKFNVWHFLLLALSSISYYGKYVPAAVASLLVNRAKEKTATISRRRSFFFVPLDTTALRLCDPFLRWIHPAAVLNSKRRLFYSSLYVTSRHLCIIVT